MIRIDGTIFGFTDHDRNIEFGGDLYEAASGIASGELEQTLGFGSDRQEVSGALISERISAEDIRADKYDGASIELWQVNWRQPDERVLDRVFVIGEIVEEDGRFRAELRGKSAGFSQVQGRRFIRNCNADLGDNLCGVNISGAAYSTTAQILSIKSPLIVTVSGLNDFEPGWFRAGHVKFTDGANADLGMEIAEHLVEGGFSILQFWKSLPFAPAQDDNLIVTAGCNKTFSQCRKKFSNTINFQGFPHIPGNDFALGYASKFDLMDGKALIP